jgi:peptidoglycan/xylan/chitin deacetylase (PgdA/CDA1 family)
MQRVVSLLIIGVALLLSAAPSAGATEQPTRRGVAFTFDDGVSARGIREILAVAVAERTPITFFPTALSLQRFPQLWREISAAGFAIGNHTDGHRSLTLLLATSGEVAVRRHGRSALRRSPTSDRRTVNGALQQIGSLDLLALRMC